MRTLLKNLNLLNLILVACGAVLTTYVLFPLLTTKVTYKPPVVHAKPDVPEEKAPSLPSPPPADYMVVAEQNLFHPERKIPPDAKDEKALPKPELLLYGTLITDTVRLAYLEDKKAPQSTPGRGKRQSVVKQGEVVSGFVLKQVESDRIVLTRGADEMVVLLNDPDKQRSAPPAAPGKGGAATGAAPLNTASAAYPGSQPSAIWPDQTQTAQAGTRASRTPLGALGAQASSASATQATQTAQASSSAVQGTAAQAAQSSAAAQATAGTQGAQPSAQTGGSDWPAAGAVHQRVPRPPSLADIYKSY